MNLVDRINEYLNEEDDFWIVIKDEKHREELAKKYEKGLGNKLGGIDRKTKKIERHTDKAFLGYDNVYKFIKSAKKVHIMNGMIVGVK